jgi:hypothetical protein
MGCVISNDSFRNTSAICLSCSFGCALGVLPSLRRKDFSSRASKWRRHPFCSILLLVLSLYSCHCFRWNIGFTHKQPKLKMANAQQDEVNKEWNAIAGEW